MADAPCHYPVSVADVRSWLCTHSFVGVDKLAATLVEHEIDGEALRLLTDDDIYRMFPNTGAAVKVRSAVHRLRQLEAAHAAGPPLPPTVPQDTFRL